jgi:hypothetical protein
MQFLWSGSWPKNKAPHLYSLQLDNKRAVDNINLQPGNSYNAVAVVNDPTRIVLLTVGNCCLSQQN